MTRVQPGLTKVEIDHLFNLVGTFFVVIQLILASTIVFDPDTRPFLFWLCNNFCFFLAIACYLKNMQLVKGISYVGLIPQLVWVTDFVASSLGFNLTGITSYLSREGFTYANNISIVLHMCVPILILVVSFKTRPQLLSILYSLQYVCIIFGATYLFSPRQDDINCVFYACRMDTFLPHTPALWPVYTIIVSFFSYLIHRVLYYGWKAYHGHRELLR